MTGAEFHGVDIDLLADYVGGALDGTPEAERVAALVAADPGWREAYELLAPEMATVGALLGALPAEPMPDDVIARLDAALALPVAGEPADVVPESVESPQSSTDAVPQTVLDLDARRRKRGNHRWVRIAAPIGIAAGVAGFFGYGVLSQSESASDSSASKAAAENAGGMVAAAPATTLSSGTDYTLGTLNTLGEALQRSTAEPLNAPDSSATMSGTRVTDLGRLQAEGALLDCLNAIAQENGGGALTVETVDYARFDGKPALVVRFTAANGKWVWASGADCGLPGGGADTRGAVPVR